MKPLLDIATLALACASTVASPSPERTTKHHAVRPPNAATLYSPHARRLVQSYLRLKLAELREADLERARAVIQRRLDVNSLFTNETSGPKCGSLPKSCHLRE